MATKSMRYDHPQYTTRMSVMGSTTAGANGTTQKYAAFTDLKLKSITATPATASTSASQPLLYVKSGTATTTTTLTALTSAAITVRNDTLSNTLAQGDHFWVTHGTDATAVLAVGIEYEVVAGANVTL